MNKFDKKCLELAISEAKKSFGKGNYPVGAVLAIDEQIISSQGNLGKEKNSLVYHAENYLIIKNGEIMYKAFKKGKKISLYSTLEPCLMCTGAATMNKVDSIFYIQNDPHAGACMLDISSIGERYQVIFPKIEHVKISNTPKELIMKFLDIELSRGNKEWAKEMIRLFSGA